MTRPILVTGGTGQLAGALAELAEGRPLMRVGRTEFDFDRPASLGGCLRAADPWLVVNAAAWTAVDAAEAEPEAAARANRDGPAELARLCAASGIRLIHVSTDYVFDGTKGAPYREDDAPNPTGVYGATKLAGEQAVRAACPEATILRTSWVYAPTGRNFVRTMLAAARRTDRLRVVADQKGCPTEAGDLARAILRLADRIAAGTDAAGIYHAAGEGWTTWHGLACAVFEAAGPLGWPAPRVEAITTADWPTPARRPADSRLDCTRLHARFGIALPPWRDTLRRVVARIVTAEAQRP